jgi:hypothetical protein
MPDYLVFRAVTPPSFDVRQYAAHSSEPIRWDCVTCVEAESGQEACEAVISATGIVATGIAAVECYSMAYGATGQIGEGGKLQAKSKLKELEESNDARMRKLERELDQLHKR